MPLSPFAYIKKKRNYIEKISKCKARPLAMCTAHHIGICPFNVRPPKTRSREEVESRQRRLGRIDSFSRRASAEPFPGWRLAGGAAAAGEQRRGPKPTSLGFPAPAEHNGASFAAAPSSRLSSQHRRPRAPDGGEWMNQRTQPRAVPGTQPPAPGGSALRRKRHAARPRYGSRGSRSHPGSSLPLRAASHSPGRRCLFTLPSAAASAGPGAAWRPLLPQPPQSASEPSAAEGAASRSAPPAWGEHGGRAGEGAGRGGAGSAALPARGAERRSGRPAEEVGRGGGGARARSRAGGTSPEGISRQVRRSVPYFFPSPSCRRRSGGQRARLLRWLGSATASSAPRAGCSRCVSILPAGGPLNSNVSALLAAHTSPSAHVTLCGGWCHAAGSTAKLGKGAGRVEGWASGCVPTCSRFSLKANALEKKKVGGELRGEGGGRRFPWHKCAKREWITHSNRTEV